VAIRCWRQVLLRCCALFGVSNGRPCEKVDLGKSELGIKPQSTVGIRVSLGSDQGEGVSGPLLTRRRWLRSTRLGRKVRRSSQSKKVRSDWHRYRPTQRSQVTRPVCDVVDGVRVGDGGESYVARSQVWPSPPSSESVSANPLGCIISRSDQRKASPTFSFRAADLACQGGERTGNRPWPGMG
jgi:hypothetical protein